MKAGALDWSNLNTVTAVVPLVDPPAAPSGAGSRMFSMMSMSSRMAAAREETARGDTPSSLTSWLPTASPASVSAVTTVEAPAEGGGGW